MTYEALLSIIANWAAILTAAVATFAYGKFLYERCDRQRRLENYLRDEKKQGVDNGQRTVLHLMARLAMTESEVLGAAFRSNKIRKALGVDEQNRANALLFEYGGDDLPTPKRF